MLKLKSSITKGEGKPAYLSTKFYGSGILQINAGVEYWQVYGPPKELITALEQVAEDLRRFVQDD